MARRREAAAVFADGQLDPFDHSEKQYGGRRGAWRLLEIIAKHGVRGTWLICGATCEKYPQVSRAVKKAGHNVERRSALHGRWTRTRTPGDSLCVLQQCRAGRSNHQSFSVNPYVTWLSNTPDFMLQALKTSFDALYERAAQKAVMMPLAVHDFIVGRPSRSKILDEFITYAKQFEGVAFTTHDELAGWWRAHRA
ncbi:MAG: polysaccharide deacetylase family protein, partial [Deltaproteobacteria bacterium]|nr:polysaccharide deacetylase family protein [Deltaproteobacteria bacterium]